MKDGVISRKIPRINIFERAASNFLRGIRRPVPVPVPWPAWTAETGSCRRNSAGRGNPGPTPHCVGRRPTITDFSARILRIESRIESAVVARGRPSGNVTGLNLCRVQGNWGRVPWNGTFRFLTPFSLLTRPLARNGYRDRWSRYTHTHTQNRRSLTVQLLSHSATESLGRETPTVSL